MGTLAETHSSRYRGPLQRVLSRFSVDRQPCTNVARIWTCPMEAAGLA
jgi:hypothetical protein